VNLPPERLQLQIFAVKARYLEGSYPLPAEKAELMGAIEKLLQRCEAEIGS
jgi:hypothetical protein